MWLWFVVLCFVAFIFSAPCEFHLFYSLIFFRVTSLALGQSYDCPSVSEVTLKDMVKSVGAKSQQGANHVNSSWEVLKIWLERKWNTLKCLSFKEFHKWLCYNLYNGEIFQGISVNRWLHKVMVLFCFCSVYTAQLISLMEDFHNKYCKDYILLRLCAAMKRTQQLVLLSSL